MAKRLKGRYFLTGFGKVIHDAVVSFETRVEDAVNNYWAQLLNELLKTGQRF